MDRGFGLSIRLPHVRRELLARPQPEEPRWAGSRICATALMANNPVSTFGLISDENRCAEAELSRGRPTQPGAAQQYSVRASRAVAGDGECAACISLRARRELDGDLSLRVVQKRDRETVPGKSACTLRCLDLHGTARRVANEQRLRLDIAQRHPAEVQGRRAEYELARWWRRRRTRGVLERSQQLRSFVQVGTSSPRVQVTHTWDGGRMLLDGSPAGAAPIQSEFPPPQGCPLQ